MDQNQTPEGKKAFKAGLKKFKLINYWTPDALKRTVDDLCASTPKVMCYIGIANGRFETGYIPVLGKYVIGTRVFQGRKGAIMEAMKFIEEADHINVD